MHFLLIFQEKDWKYFEVCNSSTNLDQCLWGPHLTLTLLIYKELIMNFVWNLNYIWKWVCHYMIDNVGIDKSFTLTLDNLLLNKINQYRTRSYAMRGSISIILAQFSSNVLLNFFTFSFYLCKACFLLVCSQQIILHWNIKLAKLIPFKCMMYLKKPCILKIKTWDRYSQFWKGYWMLEKMI